MAFALDWNIGACRVLDRHRLYQVSAGLKRRCFLLLAMQTRSAYSLRRPVTACTECRRRKQKCDREKPCNVCMGRNVPGRCMYDYSGSSDERLTSNAELPLLQSPPLTADGGYSPASLVDRPFQDQMGYARTSEGSTLSGLYDVMGYHRELQDPSPTGASTLPAFTTSHFSDLCAKLPPQPIARELIETYFAEANWYFAVLEKYYFEQLYSSWCALNDHPMRDGQFRRLPRDLLHFPALLFQVLAVALQFAPPGMPYVQALGVDGFTRRDCLSSDFSAKGMEIVLIAGRDDPTITTVQNGLMRALWLKNSSRGREAWHVLGDAIRMAQDIGLHQQSKVFQEPQSPLEETLSQLWYDEHKRRLWIKLFSWDSHMAFTLGRPRAINSSDCTAMTPLDRDIPADPATTIPMALFPHEPPSSFTPHLFQYAVCQQIHEAMSLGAHKRHLEDYSLVKNLHDRVLSLLSGLPPVHRPVNPDKSWDSSHPHIPKQRQQISTAANSFLMALHRPHAKMRTASRNAAIEAAVSTLDAQERLFDLMATGYYSIYALSVYTVDAAVFLSVATLEHPPSDPGILHRIHHVIGKAIRRLELAKERVSLANSGLKVLRRCCLKMQPLSQLQPHAPRYTLHNSIQMAGSVSSGETQLHGSSYHQPQDLSDLPDPVTMSMPELGQLDSAAMFDNITESNFDIDSWVRQMSQMNDSHVSNPGV